MRFQVDPLSRLIHIRFTVPENAPDRAAVRCAWARRGTAEWKPARVEPLLSDTATELLGPDDWMPWTRGEIVEHRAGGQERTVVFNPYPDAQDAGIVDIDFRIDIFAGGRRLSRREIRIQADNSDVVYADDWSRVMQKDAVAEADGTEPGRWVIERNAAAHAAPFAPGGTRLHGKGGAALPRLTYPLDLRGEYAIFVYAYGRVRLRLSGDERCDRLGGSLPYHEQLWKWTTMDRQHLVVRQNHAYTGPAETSLDYVKFVPLTPELVARLESRFGKPDKIVAGYWEPYSYAFADDVRDGSWHREYLTAYRDARVSIVDAQLGRFGAKMVFESRIAEQLLYQTVGDPIGAVRHPVTSNVGRMQQYTNTLQATLKFARELGLNVHANFGAGNCYQGTPLQGAFSREHPEWVRGACLRYEVPQVRKFVLSIYREALEIGARGLSIDFCRYPETIDAKETCNRFLRELRALADEFSAARREHISILVRFPARGVRRWELFDYVTWARQGWVDYLCPGGIQGRFHYFDVTPYQEAVQGTRCVLLLVIDALGWGLPWPGWVLWRAARLYERGIEGIYVYQADSPIINSPARRRYMRMLRSSVAVKRFWDEDARMRPRCSKGIYITRPLQRPGYHSWERVHVWLEGVDMGEVEVYLDGRLINRFDGPPYLVGDQGPAGDGVLPPGKHELKIRARDGNGWLVRVFHIRSAG